MGICHVYPKSKHIILMLLGFVALFSSMVSNSAPFIPPIGIPAPEFGINESHTMYADSLYDFGNGLESYKDAGYGPYTHYVDNSVSCEDSSNRYGTKDAPRCNLPTLSELAPGSVVEIHGGIYTSRNWMTSSGTLDKPIFIRGYANPNWVVQDDAEGNPVFVKTSIETMPIIERALRIRGAYIIVENIDFNKNDRRESAIDIRPANLAESVHHVAVRNSEVQNYAHAHGGAGSLMAASGYQDNFVHDIVYYKNNVHADNSFYDFNTDGDAVDQYQDDTMGIAIAARSNRVWIVDNHIHHNAGDAVGTGHAANYTSTNYYIGRNIMNDCDENAVDLKEVEHFVVSQNIMYNFYGAGAGSNGTITVVHYGPSLWPKNTWFIYNEMYNAAHNAVQVGGKMLDDVYYIGNVIHSISNALQTGTAFRSWGSRNIHIVGNTVYGTDIGLDFSGTTVEAQAFIENNIFANLKTDDYVRLSNTAYANRAVIKNNLFYSDAFTPVVDGNSINEINTNPLFQNPATHNFKPQNTPVSSPAIDSGYESDVYQVFQDRFDGMNIRVDFNGAARPQDASVWDIGAYEYNDNDLSAPSALSATVISSSQIDLSWTDNANNENGFVIESSMDIGNDFSELIRVAADVTTYSHIELSADSTYYYRVFAYNASGDSASSNSVNATTQSLNQNSVPTGIKLDNNDADSVAENTASGSVISVLSSIDADNADVHTYTLVAGAGDEDNAKFTLFESNLLLAFSPDYEKPVDLGDVVANNSYSIRLQTDDGDEGIYQQSFVITVTDIDEVVDSVAPVITLIGDRYQEVILGTVYIDLGATAMDDVQGDLTPSIEIDASAVDVTTIGIYEVIYRVSDGSNTTRARRIVEVKELGLVDTMPPVITLLGVNPQEITRGNAYIELGALANDNVDGDISAKITIDVSALDTNTAGSYTVTYNVSDAAGNAASEITRTVKVINGSATKTVIKLSALDGSLLGLGLILLAFRLRRLTNLLSIA